jgi:hypothetical protein
MPSLGRFSNTLLAGTVSCASRLGYFSVGLLQIKAGAFLNARQWVRFRLQYAPLRVSTPATTAYDLIRYAARLGGIERAVETLAPLFSLIRVPDLLLCRTMVAVFNDTFLPIA